MSENTIIGPGGSTVYDWKPVQKTSTFRDALGQPIVFGQKYGYSTSSGGIGNVVIGVALRETKTKVTLDVISRAVYVYGEIDNERKYDWPSQTVSVRSYHLFPVKD